MNNTWGQNKDNYYGRNKQSDEESDTSDDADEQEQAQMLQQIRARKMNKYAQREQDAVIQDDQDSEKEADNDIEVDSSDSEGERKKIGDKLFDDGEDKNEKGTDFRALAKEMDSDLLEQVIQKDSPELIAMLHELQESMTEINTKLKPVLDILKAKSQNPPKKLAKLPIFQKNGRTFIEMK